jgi:hypothetical protein
MKLNDQIPGLPPWPPIRLIQERNEYIVGGRNLSYPDYDRARKAIGVLVLGALFCSIILGLTVAPGLGAILAILCLASMPVFSFFPLMKFIYERAFSSNVQVRFTSNLITVNGKSYENAPHIPVQFRALCPPLSDEQICRNNELLQQGKLSKSRAYDFKFLKVEMIYGSRIVLITSVADEVRAEQFAVALQVAHDLSASQPTNRAGRPVATAKPAEDALPE